MITGIHHTGINVRDMARMLKFYTEGLGFEPAGEAFEWADAPLLDHIVDVPGSAARGIMLRAGSCYLELFHYSAPAPESTRPLRPHDRGYTHLCIDVTDIAQDMAHLKAAGMTFNDRDFVDMGHVKTLYGYDPEGNLIEVQQCAPGNGMTLDDLAPINRG